MSTVTYPNIAIIGVPKAGTTSLHYWLEKLPGVIAANPKETFYFMDEGNSMVNPKGSHRREDGVCYGSFYRHPPTNASQLTLDSTTHHFYQQTAIAHFAQHSTKACVVLREPVARLVSYFNYVSFARSGLRNPIDFSVFVEKLFDGNFQSLRPHFTDEREFFSLRTSLDQGNYQKYLRQWQAKIPEKDIKVMLFEDLLTDRKSFLLEMTSFFGIKADESDLDKFEVQNEGRSVKYPMLNRMARSASKHVSALPFYDFLKQQYSNAQKGEKLTFDWEQHASAIERLYEFYQPLNEQLSELTPFDASRWLPKTKTSSVNGVA